MICINHEKLLSLPALNDTDWLIDKPIHIKFFLPSTNSKWYVIEGEKQKDDYMFFGFINGTYNEWGYFTLSDLNLIRSDLGHTVQIDEEFSNMFIDSNNHIKKKE